MSTEHYFIPHFTGNPDDIVGYAAEPIKKGDLITFVMTQAVPATMRDANTEVFLMAQKRPVPMVRKVKR